MSANERMVRRLQDAADIVHHVALVDPFVALTVGVKWCVFCGNGEGEHEHRADCVWVKANEFRSGVSWRGAGVTDG